MTDATRPRLVEIEPGRFRIARPGTAPARSVLPSPHVIGDTMPPTEQVDGKFYTSKSAFRAVGRSLGLTEVGSEKITPRRGDPAAEKKARRASIERATARHKAGERPKT